MAWAVVFHDEFDREFRLLGAEVQDEHLAHARLRAQFGPTLGRLGWIRSKDRITRT